ncbi:MAG TPA: 60S ribosomal export protein NMD3, partial [Candidatus Thermoplasmatota archaeon]|nr:60S ribosomal export protein NMD3 [Candidatus Thermoplasmatota archaeon]
LPPVVRVEVCAACGARRRAGSWGDPLPSLDVAIREQVREGVEVDRRVTRWELELDGGEHDPTNFEYEGIVRGKAGALPFEVRAPLVVHVQRSTCQRCGRRAGGYYESILQLRAEGRAIEADERERAAAIIERGLANLRAGGDLDSFLVKAKEVRGGWDFYLGTVHAGREIAKRLAGDLGAALKETASLVGRDRTGEDLYRVTISVKLPPARVGGFVALDEKLYAVASVGPKSATLLDLEEHRRVTRPRHDLASATILQPNRAVEAVVVSETARELQVLDPETLRTVDVVKPPGFPEGRASVHVVPWSGRLWLLPAPAGAADRLT